MRMKRNKGQKVICMSDKPDAARVMLMMHGADMRNIRMADTLDEAEAMLKREHGFAMLSVDTSRVDVADHKVVAQLKRLAQQYNIAVLATVDGAPPPSTWTPDILHWHVGREP